MCDEGCEVWLHPGEISTQDPIIPSGPDWVVGDELHVTPGSTRWATADEVAVAWPAARKPRAHELHLRDRRVHRLVTRTRREQDVRRQRLSAEDGVRHRTWVHLHGRGLRRGRPADAPYVRHRAARSCPSRGRSRRAATADRCRPSPQPGHARTRRSTSRSQGGRCSASQGDRSAPHATRNFGDGCTPTAELPRRSS